MINSNFECFEIVTLLWIRLLGTNSYKMASKIKHDEVSLKVKYEELKELGKSRAPENLDADGLVDFDREVATNKSKPLSVNKIVNEYLLQPVETVEHISNDENEFPDEPISPSSQNEVDGAVEILNRLALFTTDLESDLLLLKVSKKSVEEDLMKWSNLL